VSRGAGQVDFTELFRRLGDVPLEALPDTPDAAWAAAMAGPLAEAFYEPPGPEAAAAWGAWLVEYAAAARGEGRGAAARRSEMAAANPAVVLRGWMAAAAYEAAEAGDARPAGELLALLRRPYDDPDPAAARRWLGKAPRWAQGLPGVAFFSCSS
jgi:uncharacterized protein YdiU (UPF0061 family)